WADRSRSRATRDRARELSPRCRGVTRSEPRRRLPQVDQHCRHSPIEVVFLAQAELLKQHVDPPLDGGDRDRKSRGYGRVALALAHTGQAVERGWGERREG